MSRLYTFAPILLVFAFLELLNILLPMQGDDYVLLNQSNGLQSIIRSYYTWNPRIYELLYNGYLIRLNSSVFDLFNSCIGTAFIISLFYLLFSYTPKLNKLNDMFLLSMLLFLLCSATAFEAVFLWGDGSVNYLWGGAEAVFILIAFKNYNIKANDSILSNVNTSNLDSSIYKKSKTFNITMCLFALTAAMSNEVIAVFLMFSYIAFITYLKIKSFKIPKVFIVSFVFALAGLLYLLLSPGAIVRANFEATKYNYLGFGELLDLGFSGICERIFLILSSFVSQTPEILLVPLFVLIFFRIYTNRIPYKMIAICGLSVCIFCVVLFKIPLLGILILLCMQAYVTYKNKNGFNITILVLFCIWILMGLSYIQIGKNFPLRGRSIDLILLISICMLYLKIYIFKIKKIILIAGLCLIMVFFTYTTIQYIKLRINWDNLVSYVDEQKKLNGKNIDIIYPKDKFNNNYFMISTFFKPDKQDIGYFDLSYVFGVKSFKFK